MSEAVLRRDHRYYIIFISFDIFRFIFCRQKRSMQNSDKGGAQGCFVGNLTPIENALHQKPVCYRGIWQNHKNCHFRFSSIIRLWYCDKLQLPCEESFLRPSGKRPWRLFTNWKKQRCGMFTNSKEQNSLQPSKEHRSTFWKILCDRLFYKSNGHPVRILSPDRLSFSLWKTTTQS